MSFIYILSFFSFVFTKHFVETKGMLICFLHSNTSIFYAVNIKDLTLSATADELKALPAETSTEEE